MNTVGTTQHNQTLNPPSNEDITAKYKTKGDKTTLTLSLKVGNDTRSVKIIGTGTGISAYEEISVKIGRINTILTDTNNGSNWAAFLTSEKGKGIRATVKDTLNPGQKNEEKLNSLIAKLTTMVTSLSNSISPKTQKPPKALAQQSTAVKEQMGKFTSEILKCQTKLAQGEPGAKNALAAAKEGLRGCLTVLKQIKSKQDDSQTSKKEDLLLSSVQSCVSRDTEKAPTSTSTVQTIELFQLLSDPKGSASKETKAFFSGLCEKLIAEEEKLEGSAPPLNADKSPAKSDVPLSPDDIKMRKTIEMKVQNMRGAIAECLKSENPDTYFKGIKEKFEGLDEKASVDECLGLVTWSPSDDKKLDLSMRLDGPIDEQLKKCGTRLEAEIEKLDAIKDSEEAKKDAANGEDHQPLTEQQKVVDELQKTLDKYNFMKEQIAEKPVAVAEALEKTMTPIAKDLRSVMESTFNAALTDAFASQLLNLANKISPDESAVKETFKTDVEALDTSYKKTVVDAKAQCDAEIANPGVTILYCLTQKTGDEFQIKDQVGIMSLTRPLMGELAGFTANKIPDTVGAFHKSFIRGDKNVSIYEKDSELKAAYETLDGLYDQRGSNYGAYLKGADTFINLYNSKKNVNNS